VKKLEVAKWAVCERRDDRYPLADAWVVWEDSAGQSRRLQILDASRQGLCLGLEPDSPSLPEGLEMEGVVLCIAGVEMRGRLRVTQSTTSLTRGVACGGEFAPASFEDDERFRKIVAELEHRVHVTKTSS
jgi:hypothetical protein